MKIIHENQVPWPAAKPRTADRKAGPFKTTMADATERIEREVGAFTRTGRDWRTNELYIYSEAPLGVRLRFLSQRTACEPSVVVRFDLDGKTYSFAADRYDTPEQNLCGIADYIKAIRAQERNGVLSASEMLGAFALPQAASGRDWFEGCVTAEEIEAKFRDLAKKHHPDVGGNAETFSAITLARAQKLEALNG